MEKKEQEQYALLLMKKMQEIINENIRERGRYKQVLYKKQNHSEMNNAERETYWKKGIAIKRSVFSRVRIELNEILKEMEKNYGNN